MFQQRQSVVSAMLRALLLAIFSAGPVVAQTPKTDRAIEYADLAGHKHKPLSVPETKATVLFFLMQGCPNSNGYAPEIKRICDTYEPKKVAAFIVHADPDMSVEDARKHAKDFSLPCPVLLDPYQRLVEYTGVTTAPEVAVLSPEGRILYKGRIDDLFVDFGKRRPEPTRRDLREALDAIIAGKEVKTSTTKAIGCPLPEPRK
jgi:AhpC/TSA family